MSTVVFVDIDQLIEECQEEYAGWISSLDTGNPCSGDLFEASAWLGRRQWLEGIKAQAQADKFFGEPDHEDD